MLHPARRGTRVLLLLTCVLLSDGAVTAAEDRVDFFHALILRRPVMEQEVETQVRGTSGRSGSEGGVTTAIDLRLTPRWQVELVVPWLLSAPSNEPSTVGISDVVIQNKVLFFESLPNRALVAGGLDVTVPSGDSKRHLGGHVAVSPFLTAGIALGRLEVLADAGYRWDVDGLDRRAQQIIGGVAVGWALGRWTPFVEATTGIEIRRASVGAERTLTATHANVGPGLNVNMTPGRTLLFSVELPVMGPRRFDYEARLGFVWDF
jgi:hypothetical protein